MTPTGVSRRATSADTILRALAYAERACIACLWIDDPGGRFPPEKRPARDASAR